MKRNLDENAFAAALRQTPVPEGLRASLIKGSPARETRPSAADRRRLPGWQLGMAAMLVFGLGAAWALILQPKLRFDRTEDYREAMAYFVGDVPFKLDFKTDNLQAIAQWLEDSGSPVPERIPVKLMAKTPLGCKQIDWGGTTVTLICFYASIPQGQLVHLFVVDRDAVGEQAIRDLDQALSANGFETRGWLSEAHACLLVPSQRGMAVRHFVES